MKQSKIEISGLPKKVQDAINGGNAFLEGGLKKLYFKKEGETQCTVYTGSVNEIQRKVKDLINEGATLPNRVARMVGKNPLSSKLAHKK